MPFIIGNSLGINGLKQMVIDSLYEFIILCFKPLHDIVGDPMDIILLEGGNVMDKGLDAFTGGKKRSN